MKRLTNDQKQFLVEIQVYCTAIGISLTEFGKKAIKDPALVTKLNDGRDLRLSTLKKIKLFMNGEAK